MNLALRFKLWRSFKARKAARPAKRQAAMQGQSTRIHRMFERTMELKRDGLL